MVFITTTHEYEARLDKKLIRERHIVKALKIIVTWDITFAVLIENCKFFSRFVI